MDLVRESPAHKAAWMQGGIGIPKTAMMNVPIALGKYWNNDPNWPTGQFFSGKMDEVRFWNGVRSSSDIWSATTFYPNRTVVTGMEPWLITNTSPAVFLAASYNFNEVSLSY